MCTFDEVTRDAKNEYYILNVPSSGRTEIENLTDRTIFMFSISALPPEGAFQMFTHF